MFKLNQGVYKNKIAVNTAMKELTKLCYNQGTLLRPITFGDVDLDTENALEIFSIRNKEIPLWYALARFYCDELKYNLDLRDIGQVRAVLIDYLLRSNLCYIEIIADTQKSNESNYKTRAVKDKYISSKNAIIVADFEGVTPSLCANRYEDNFDIDEEDIEVGEIPYIKYNFKTGKIVKCNKDLVIESCRIVSIPLISEWLKGVCKVMENSLVEFTYLKDDDTERTLVSTLNRDILRRYYSDERVNSMLFASLAGEDMGDPTYLPFKGVVDRGWIKVPEVGSSIIDDSGTRSVNFARIKKLQIVDTVDTTFIKVSLNKVIEEFNKRLDIHYASGDVSAVTNIYNTLSRYGFSQDLRYPIQYYKTDIEVLQAIRSFIATKQYAGTPFRRMLHTYMVTNPDLFPNYIGQEVEDIKLNANFGIGVMDF